jgi:hypothetical protein
MKVAVIPADPAQPVRVQETKRIDLDFLKNLVDGWIEAVGLRIAGNDEPDLTMFLNEEGKLQGLPVNPRATVLAWRVDAIYPNDHIAGTAVIAGPTDARGYETGLDDTEAALILALFDRGGQP